MDAYEKKDLIETGEFGEVFKVLKKEREEVYAMKVITIDKNTDEKSINNEIEVMKAISAMEHPNIIKCFDHLWEKDKNQYTIIMEYCPKGSLRKVLDEYASMGEHISQGQLLKYLFEMLSGVEYLHSKKIVHRDLSPEHILIGNDGHLKISNFGIPRELCRSETYPLSSVKNFKYMNSEILNREKPSASSDMWSIGCILHELCCLKLPYPIEIENPSDYIKYIKTNEYNSSLIPNQYIKELRDLISIMLNTVPSSQQDCGEILKNPIFEYKKDDDRMLFFDKGKKYYGEWLHNKKNGRTISNYDYGTSVLEEWKEGKFILL